MNEMLMLLSPLKVIAGFQQEDFIYNAGSNVSVL